MRRAGVDVGIDEEDVLSARDLFGKLRRELRGAANRYVGTGREEIEDAMCNAVVTSQGIAHSDAQSVQRPWQGPITNRPQITNLPYRVH